MGWNTHLNAVQALEISVDGPGGQLPVVDRLHRRLRHSSQIAAAEYSRLAAQAAKDLILTLIPSQYKVLCSDPTKKK